MLLNSERFMALAELNQITQIKFTNLTSKAERLC